MSVLRIFISSPSDVEVERQIAMQVIQRLSLHFQNSVELKPILWEREPLLASGHFQDALDPATADIMVCILWSRLGSPLPDKFKGVDGRTGLTGTEWEFEYAEKARQESGKPDILVYRKTSNISLILDDETSTRQALDQKHMVEDFFQNNFHNQDESNTFKRAYFPFDATQEFEQQLEPHLQKLIEKHLDQLQIENQTSITWHSGSPYKGLAAYDESYQTVFFGRTKAIGELMSQYKQQVSHGIAFVMVTGMSGCGKSSLINAGTLPLLTTPRVVQYDVGHLAMVRIKPSQCHHDQGPLMGLCQLLVQQLPAFGEQQTDEELLYEQVLHSPKSLKHTLQQVLNTIKQQQTLHQKVQVRIQLILDQVEELYTTKAYSRKQQQQFWLGIQQLLNTQCVWCIGSMRSDFECQGEGSKLVELMRDKGRYQLQPPENYEIEQIIQQPAHAAGLYFEQLDERDLATQLRLDAEQQPGSLPLLAFCLNELFSLKIVQNDQPTLTFEAYEQQLGGLTGAISKRAETVIQQLKHKHNIDTDQLLPRLFNLLIQVNPDNPDEPATARNIANNHFPPDSDENTIIQALVSNRLLITDETTTRIAHEALIHKWERVQQWLAIDKEFLTWKARTEREAYQWHQDNKDKARLLAKGKPLSDAENWLDRRETDLAENVVRFIKASITQARHRQRNQFLFTAAIIIGLSLFALIAFQQKNLAIAERDKVQSLLNEVRNNLSFMNDSLLDIMDKYVPTKEHINISKAIDQLSDALTKYRDTNNAADLREQGVILRQKADLILKSATHDPKQALLLYQQSLAIAQKLVQIDPDNTQYQRDLVVVYKKLGDLQQRQGEVQAASTAYQQALVNAQKLVKIDPDNTPYQRDLSVAYQNMGDIRLRQRDTQAALEAYQQGLIIAQKLVQVEPDNAQYQRNLWFSYQNMGDIQLRQGDTQAALAAYQQAEVTVQKLVQTDPGNIQNQRYLAVSYQKMGDIQLHQENYTQAALADYQQALIITQKLAQTDPGNIEYQRDLALSYQSVSDIQLHQGETQAALATYQKALVIAQKLVQTVPGNTQYQRDLSVCYNKLGDIQLRQGDTQAALAAYQQALVIAQKLVQTVPGNTQYQRDVIVSYYKLYDLDKKSGRLTDAQENIKQAHQLLVNMQKNQIIAPDDIQYIEIFHQFIQDLEKEIAAQQ